MVRTRGKGLPIESLAVGAESDLRCVGLLSVEAPRNQRQVWATTQMMRVLPRLPATIQRGLSSFVRAPARALESVDLTRYEPMPAANGRRAAG